MKNILYFCFIFCVILLISHTFYYLPQTKKLTHQIYFAKSLQMKSLLNSEIHEKKERIKTISYLITADNQIAKSLISKDISNLIYYKNVIERIKNNSTFKNITLQVFDKEGNIFYRSHPEVIADLFPELRADIKQVIKTQNLLHTVSVGKFDLSIRSIFPIFYEDNLVGIMEVISKFNSISKILKNQNIELLAIVDASYTKSFIKPFSNLFIGKNYVANVDASKELMKKVEKYGLNKLFHINDYIIFDKFLVTTNEIKSIDNKDMSFFILFSKLKDIDMSLVNDFKINYFLQIIVLGSICFLLFLLFINKIYTKTLKLEIKKQTLKVQEQQYEIERIFKIRDRYVSFTMTDLKGIITNVSSAFCKISGYTKDELIGKPHSIIRHHDMTKKFFQNMWEQLRKKQVIKVVIKNRKKDGSAYWVESDIGPYFDRDGNHIGYFSVRKDITTNKELEELQKKIILLMSSIAESRNKETSEHIERVSRYSEILAKGYGLSKKKIQMIKLASQMHDIGKIRIPYHTLDKCSPLAPEEFELIKTHPMEGYKILDISQIPLLQMAAQIALTHHEKYDGTGYPQGLKGENIPIYGRIVALADVFDALSTNRCYKKAWEMDEILKYINDKKGKQFDPKLVDIFFKKLDEILEVKENIVDNTNYDNQINLTN